MELGLSDVMQRLVAPLVLADRGELYVVRLDREVIELHLRGRFSGCPGSPLAIREVLEPALRLAAPEAEIRISSGEVLPEGARLWSASEPPPPNPEAARHVSIER